MQEFSCLILMGNRKQNLLVKLSKIFIKPPNDILCFSEQRIIEVIHSIIGTLDPAHIQVLVVRLKLPDKVPHHLFRSFSALQSRTDCIKRIIHNNTILVSMPVRPLLSSVCAKKIAKVVHQVCVTAKRQQVDVISIKSHYLFLLF